MESNEGMSSSVIRIQPENLTPMTGTIPGALSSVYAQGLTGSSEMKKKRGRPRKNGPDGPISKGAVSTSTPPATGNFVVEKGSFPGPVSLEKKKRKKKQRMGTEKLGDWVSCSTGGNFLPHTLTVDAGEDVAEKVISFCQRGPRAICIISAAGLISSVTLRQPNSSGGTLTYEGRFEIISLSGSFTPTEFGGSQGQSGGITIALAGPDGRVVGGLLAGLLIAATPIKVSLTSFLPISHHEVVKPKKHKLKAKMMITNGTGYAGAIPYTSSNVEQGLESSVNQTIAYASSFQSAYGAPPPLPRSNDSRKSAADINVLLRRSVI